MSADGVGGVQRSGSGRGRGGGVPSAPAAATGSGSPAGAGAEAGFTLVEVMVALALFAVLASAVLATVTDSVGLTRANEGRVGASQLAERVLETARLADPTAPVTPSQVVTVGGVAYTVTRTVESVQQSGTSGRCGVSANRTVAQRLHVGVDWPGRRSGDPVVRLSSLRTVDLNAVAPDSGTLSVVVEDRNGASVSGVTVTLSPTGATATSDTAGCAVFAAVAARADYSVRLSRSGYADAEGTAEPTRGPLTVARGGTTDELFVYSPSVPESAPGGLTVSPTCVESSPPAYLGASSTAAVTDSATSITVSKPTGTESDDLMLAQVAVATGPDPSTLVAPSGWTTLSVDRVQYNITQGVYYRWASSSAANSSTWSYPKGKATAGITVYRGVHRKAPVNVWGVQGTTSSSTSITAPSVTTTWKNVRLVGLFSAAAGATWTPPGGMTERYDISTGTGASNSHAAASIAGQDVLTAGATGTRTATLNQSAHGVAHVVALAPRRTPHAAISWSSTSWPSADGYYLRRSVGGLLQRDWTVAGRTATGTTDGPLVNGTAYQFELSAYAGSADTDPLSATLTPDC